MKYEVGHKVSNHRALETPTPKQPAKDDPSGSIQQDRPENDHKSERPKGCGCR